MANSIYNRSRKPYFNQHTEAELEILGLKPVMDRLNREIQKVKKRTLLGMAESITFLHQKMLTEYPVIPKDSGNLRETWFIHTFDVPVNPSIEFGFTAFYAPFVHEMLEPEIHWTEPNSGPKFLEVHIKRNLPAMLKIIKMRATIPTTSEERKLSWELLDVGTEGIPFYVQRTL